jgi:hypothetical protein
MTTRWGSGFRGGVAVWARGPIGTTSRARYPWVPRRCLEESPCYRLSPGPICALGAGSGKSRKHNSAAAPLHAFFPLDRASADQPQASAGGSVSAPEAAVTTGRRLISWLASLNSSFILYPWDSKLQLWTGVATLAAALSGFLIPWEVAFVPVTHI